MSRIVNAGVIDDYESGEPVHFNADRFGVVRLGEDLVLALSDRDTHPDFTGGACRIVWREDALLDLRYGWFRAGAAAGPAESEPEPAQHGWVRN